MYAERVSLHSLSIAVQAGMHAFGIVLFTAFMSRILRYWAKTVMLSLRTPRASRGRG